MLPSNDPKLKSWVNVPENSDFPVQNLPFGVFKYNDKKPRVGVAIGDQVLDLAVLCKKGYLKGCGLGDRNVFRSSSLLEFLSLGKKVTSKVRDRVSLMLRHDNPEIRNNKKLVKKVLIPVKDVTMQLPVKPPNYTDFYSSMEHAINVGSMFRDPENALLPNWKHLPVGYHGRSSSIIPSGVPVHRPLGQFKVKDKPEPDFGPSQKLDFELEMAFITCGSTELGESISVDDADDYIFGFVLFNDWSARDIQAWEYVPLGPFLGKSFASSVSPWVVTLDALEPFRVDSPAQEPRVLPYLQSANRKNFDINLEVAIMPEGKKESIVCRSNPKYLYWNFQQQLAHQSVNGCNIEVGDMYASGTISGPDPASFGSMLELTWNGSKPLKLSDGSKRTFINDRDTVIIKGFAQHDNIRIGFGELRTTIKPAKSKSKK